ncbi:MAG: NepR family anti-sigma factor [Sphingomicrobium sp.]
MPPEGDERLSGSNQVDPRKGNSSHVEDPRDERSGGKAGAKKKPTGHPADVGRALRSVYDDTLREDIPADLRDLLGRLG